MPAKLRIAIVLSVVAQSWGFLAGIGTASAWVAFFLVVGSALYASGRCCCRRSGAAADAGIQALKVCYFAATVANIVSLVLWALVHLEGYTVNVKVVMCATFAVCTAATLATAIVATCEHSRLRAAALPQHHAPPPPPTAESGVLPAQPVHKAAAVGTAHSSSNHPYRAQQQQHAPSADQYVTRNEAVV
ncbi:hypothetical protein JKP88DRAFT_243433 [Tribonema minus]|uniref:Uncharacterized protein n=1 Tax=Tribonema minus TaxID=303371 RepID=A0A835Z8J5_9STRA|nr:hypothetical protein JKP88DRAFT_243433 [Tribonema minus]